MNRDWYYTFGSDHERSGSYAVVSVPEQYDPRPLLIGWLGSNAFGSEYSQEQWPQVQAAHHQDQPPAVIIRVDLP